MADSLPLRHVGNEAAYLIMIDTGSFKEKVAIQYRESVRDILVPRFRLVAPITIFLYIIFNFLDYEIYPHLARFFLHTRLFNSLVIAILFLLTFFKKTKKYILWYINISAFMISSSMCLMVYLSNGSNSPYYSGVNLVFLGLSFINPFYYVGNFLFCFVQIIIYNLAMFANGSAFNLVNFCFANFFLLSTALFVAFLSEFSGRHHFNGFMREQEIRDAYLKLRETQDQLIQSEKLSAIGQLASGVAHEVRNPLGIILQGVNYLEKRISTKEKDISETLAQLKDSVKNADKIISALLDFSKPASLDLRQEDVNSILEVSLSLLKDRFKFENIDVILETKKDIPKVLVDNTKLEQVFINVLLNAVQSMPNGGKIIIRSYDKQLEEVKNGIGRRREDHFQIGETAVIVEIEDTGIGIPEENLKKIFDPFFTTKGSIGGSGLGLSVTRNIIHMHKGLIYAESQIGKGTKVIIVFKIAKR